MNVQKKFYAVKCQEGNRLFTSWEEAKEYLVGKKNVLHQSFLTEEEAVRFLKEEPFQIPTSMPVAYIDGSYDVKTGCYAFGGVLLLEDKCYTFSKKYEADCYSSFRNVAGEIKGAGFILQYCIRLNIKEVTIVYDYVGIEKWFTGKWKANSLIAQNYVAFAKQIQNRIKVHFVKVKSHSNNPYNDQADRLAKQALGLQ